MPFGCSPQQPPRHLLTSCTLRSCKRRESVDPVPAVRAGEGVHRREVCAAAAWRIIQGARSHHGSCFEWGHSTGSTNVTQWQRRMRSGHVNQPHTSPSRPPAGGDRERLHHPRPALGLFIHRLHRTRLHNGLRLALSTVWPLLLHGQVDIVRFQTDAESVGEVLCARARDLRAVALVIARCASVYN